MLGLGMLGATACSSCTPPPEDTTSTAAPPQSYSCGAGTHRVGNQCVGNIAPKTQAQAISTTGNN